MPDRVYKGICPVCNSQVMITDLELHTERFMPEDELRVELDAAKEQVKEGAKTIQELREEIARLRYELEWHPASELPKEDGYYPVEASTNPLDRTELSDFIMRYSKETGWWNEGITWKLMYWHVPFPDNPATKRQRQGDRK